MRYSANTLITDPSSCSKLHINLRNLRNLRTKNVLRNLRTKNVSSGIVVTKWLCFVKKCFTQLHQFHRTLTLLALSIILWSSMVLLPAFGRSCFLGRYRRLGSTKSD